MRLRPLAAALLLAAGCENLPEIRPPGFEDGQGLEDNQLFFPTGMAVTDGGTLLVANGNFGHAFSGGTMVSFSSDYLHQLYRRTADAGIDCSVPTGLFDAADAGQDGGNLAVFPPGCDVDAGDIQFQSAVMIGNYSGPLALSDPLADGSAIAYSGSRDSNTLNAVRVDAQGNLSCAADAGTTPDCRGGLLNTRDAMGLEGPYAIVPGDASLPGAPSQRVMFIGSLIPSVDFIQNGVPVTHSVVGALPMDGDTPLFSMTASNQLLALGVGIGPMLYDAARRRLVLGGCYQRFGGTGAGEPASSKCVSSGFNFLLGISVDDGAQATATVLADLFEQVSSLDLAAMAYSGFDPATNAPTTIWATMRNPDTLVKIALPLSPAVSPSVVRIIPLPTVPGEVVVIPRAGRGDVVAVASERMGAVTIYDDDALAVVANVERLGDTPYGLKLYAIEDGVARLVSGVFAGCSVALLDVPLDDPSRAALRARIGGCEQ